ncbi:FAD-dependent oxidoreductase [Candidatus Pacearchaeota archaeon]|nr:FAD-dependent oxidoreductase [Candidatus Pacearchaeota archaeon]
MTEKYDFAIIGAGGTGLAAAMYGARLGLKTVVYGTTYGTELPVGGVITTTNIVENYPGFKIISGQELAKKLEEHARAYDLVSIRKEKVESITKSKNLFLIKTNKGEHESKTILFSTGTKWKSLDVAGSKELEGRGISYCALCDGPLYKDKIVAVVGGSDSAAKDALLLSEHAKKVYIIYRGDKIRPEPINLKRIEMNKKIEVINNTNIKEIKGKDYVTSIILDKEHKGKKELALEGVFVAIGHIILSDLAKPLGVKLNNHNEIIIDHKTSETNVPGIFAAGDVTDKQFKQLITGVADGCTAAYSAYEFINK